MADDYAVIWNGAHHNANRDLLESMRSPVVPPRPAKQAEPRTGSRAKPGAVTWRRPQVRHGA